MKNDCVELLAALVSIDSVNPDLVPGAKGEGEIAAYVAEWLGRRGLEVHVEDSGRKERPNVVAVARGTGGGKSLMLNAHMDTVGIAGMEGPFQPQIRDGRLFGRGAMDTMAALAAFLVALAEARELPLRGDALLTAVVDEEYASAGTEAVVRKWKADAAVVGEPTGLQIVTGWCGSGQGCRMARPLGGRRLFALGRSAPMARCGG
ncbi:MAG: M20/M25/M40 family metallo-hydrolase [Spirochaetia bacterium]